MKIVKIKNIGLILSIILLSLNIFSCSEIEGDNQSNLKIYGGTKVKKGEWQSTVGISKKGGNYIYCTGTIVHPRLVITAEHCIIDGDGKPSGEYEIYVGLGGEGGIVKPQYQSEKVLNIGDIYRDVAFITTTKEIDIDPEHIIPILYKKEERETVLAPGAYSHIVGFGKYKDLHTNKTGRGLKYEAETSIDKIDPIITDGTEIKIGGNDKIKDACNGDSGGPAYGKTKDGEWRVYGIVSRGGECGHGGVSGLMHSSICEIEELSGIDLDLGDFCSK